MYYNKIWKLNNYKPFIKFFLTKDKLFINFIFFKKSPQTKRIGRIKDNPAYSYT